jgi:excisionase family DNA binding protein
MIYIETHYTVRQVAEFLACSTKTIRRLIKAEKLTPIHRRESGIIMIPKSAVVAYMEALGCRG